MGGNQRTLQIFQSAANAEHSGALRKLIQDFKLWGVWGVQHQNPCFCALAGRCHLSCNSSATEVISAYKIHKLTVGNTVGF